MSEIQELQEAADKAAARVAEAFAMAEALRAQEGETRAVRELFVLAARAEREAAQAMRALLRGHLDALARSLAPQLPQVADEEYDDDDDDDDDDSWDSWDD